MPDTPFHFDRLAGIDFTSRPTRRKPITIALGRVCDRAVQLGELLEFTSFDELAVWLTTPGPWLAGFDFPFGLPRELIEAFGWPTDWLALMQHYAAQPRAKLRERFVAFCAARPAGAKFAHRRCDRPAGSSPSMKWVNPPVAWMMHAGIPLLIEAGVDLPGLHRGDPRRVALEAYPGLLARELIANRSYKSDDRSKQTPQRRQARDDLLDALQRGATRLALRLELDGSQRQALLDDGSGDRLDAVLCLVQAAWASTRPGFGLPADIDPLEGWIVTA